MEIKKFKIGKNHFEFVCDDFSTSRNWGHKVTLFKNNYQLQHAKKLISTERGRLIDTKVVC